MHYFQVYALFMILILYISSRMQSIELESNRLTRSALRPDWLAPLHFNHRFNSTTCNSDGSRPSRETPGMSASTRECVASEIKNFAY